MEQIAFYRKNPFVRLLLPLIIGILVAKTFHISPIYLLGVIAVFFIFLIIFFFNSKSYVLRHVNGILISVLVFIIGLYISQTDAKNAWINDIENNALFIAKVKIIPVEKEKSYKAEILLEAFKHNELWLTQNSTLLIYFEKDSSVANLKAGQQIVFAAKISDLPLNYNKIGFDYSKYLSIKGIQGTLFLEKDNWQLLNQSSYGIKYLALNIRATVINKFQSFGITGDELGVLSALTVGYKDNLSSKIRSAYAGAGAMHVLAVSGLHVGIVYLILLYLLSFFKYLLKKQRIKYLLIIILLWAYAFITGLSPSVTRSTVMFTFILIGHILSKRIHIYNSLAASAFLLLLINPNLLYNVGFQLSYIAVIGIVFFQPKIYKLFYISNYFFDKIWALTSVSLAAQIVTFPVCIYYFHQFPVYFWLSNIVVIIAATLLIYLTVLVFLFSFSDSISMLVSWLIQKILFFNNTFIYWINDLPNAVLEGITFTWGQVIILYLTLTFFGVWIVYKKANYFLATLCSVLLFSMLTASALFENSNQKLMSVFHFQRQTGIQFINGSQSVWISSNKNDTSMFQRLQNDSKVFWGINETTEYNLNEINDSTIYTKNFFFKNGFWMFGDKKGLIIHSDSKIPIVKARTNIDYLMVSGSPPFKLSDLANIEINTIIIDGSVPKWRISDWDMSQNKSIIYKTEIDGAFIKNICN
ncbi:MAG: ComEC/Rec2 family competence protein [Salinivirgaceae bacterium]|nr:ComEC/Rec2 family competence protein [Salinivirgaceae bacterium]